MNDDEKYEDHISQQTIAAYNAAWPWRSCRHRKRPDASCFEHGDEAFVRYECELKDGARFRNTEYFRIEGNKIREVEVCFGSPVKTAAADATPADSNSEKCPFPHR